VTALQGETATSSGMSLNGALHRSRGNAASASTTAIDVAVTRPNTVKPPFCASRFLLLSARLTNHSLVALSGRFSSLAIATVPRRLLREALNSFLTCAPVGMCARLGKAYPPACSTKPGIERCTMVLS
jgi:hypothetical protein